MKFFYYYLAAISVFAVFLTVYDKRAARKGKWRISESALLCTAALGGSVAMFLTMLIILLQIVFAAFVANGILLQKNG